MKRPVHLVGSVPLENAETVIKTCCSMLGETLSRVPDGETGIRSNWINWQRDILGAHPAMHLVGEGKNAERSVPKYAVRNDFDGDIEFTELGYFTAAIESYQIFANLQQQGEIGNQRFQVSLPTPLAAVACYVDEGSQERIFQPYRERLLLETEKILAAIPSEHLSIQWDVAIEFAVLEGLFPVWFDDPLQTIARQLIELAETIPMSVEVGFHFCYGDAGNKHFKEPDDMGLLVKLANEIAPNVNRAVDWIHMPVPIDRSDNAYFQPLEELDQHNLKQLFLGLLHEQDGTEGARKRMDAADAFVADYGIATECGLGRRKPEIIPELLALHAKLV